MKQQPSVKIEGDDFETKTMKTPDYIAEKRCSACPSDAHHHKNSHDTTTATNEHRLFIRPWGIAVHKEWTCCRFLRRGRYSRSINAATWGLERHFLEKVLIMRKESKSDVLNRIFGRRVTLGAAAGGRFMLTPLKKKKTLTAIQNIKMWMQLYQCKLFAEMRNLRGWAQIWLVIAFLIASHGIGASANPAVHTARQGGTHIISFSLDSPHLLPQTTEAEQKMAEGRKKTIALVM